MAHGSHAWAKTTLLTLIVCKQVNPWGLCKKEIDLRFPRINSKLKHIHGGEGNLALYLRNRILVLYVGVLQPSVTTENYKRRKWK